MSNVEKDARGKEAHLDKLKRYIKDIGTSLNEADCAEFLPERNAAVFSAVSSVYACLFLIHQHLEQEKEKRAQGEPAQVGQIMRRRVTLPSGHTLEEDYSNPDMINTQYTDTTHDEPRRKVPRYPEKESE